MTGRSSLGDGIAALKALPTAARVLWMALSAVAGAVGAIGTGLVWLDGFARDAEVAAQVAPLATRDEVDRAVGSLRMDTEQDRRLRLKRDVAVFEHLVSLQAADMEPDHRRRAEAAAFARSTYRDAIARGQEPEDAAQYARDKRPPWRK